MDTNSPKPTQSALGTIEAIKILRVWLDQNGGNSKIPQVLDLMAERAAEASRTGNPQPEDDAEVLRQLHRDKYGGSNSDAAGSRWLPRAMMETWWRQREEQIHELYRSSGMSVVPRLVVVPGGGRSNPTLYRLGLSPLADGELNDTSISAASAPEELDGHRVRYQSEPAKLAWWLRLATGSKPFRMRSWRGYLLIGMMLAEALALLSGWLLAIMTMRGTQPVRTIDLGFLLAMSALNIVWWQLMKPLIRLPIERVTVANDGLLAYSQLHGQLRLVRDSQSKLAGGWFHADRHFATCPICSGTIEITDGGETFPGRLVGRCMDSPMEHVYSFDPTSFLGVFLRYVESVAIGGNNFRR